MKKMTAIILATTALSVFSAKQMVVSSGGVETKYVVADIDSITFETIGGEITNPAGMKLIPAKDASFTMGDGSKDNATHQVTLTKNFYMDSTEVTQKEYVELMSTTFGASYIEPNWDYGEGDNYPAYYSSWFGAVLYANAKSIQEGRDTVYSYTSIDTSWGKIGVDYSLVGISTDISKNGYRLPTEAEWEYASRGGATTDYYWGTTLDSEYAWYNQSATNEVATKKPNSYGLYDMSGNLREWTNDWFASYGSGAETDPTGPSSADKRVFRGGGWMSNDALSSSHRLYAYDNKQMQNTGFRLVCPVK